MATKIKVNGKWYRGSEKADGLIEFKDDLNYYGSTTQVEYTAKKPNPVLHPGLYHVYNMNGGKEGEFWTDPQISYSGCITDIETDIRNSSSNSSTVSPVNTSSSSENYQNYPQYGSNDVSSGSVTNQLIEIDGQYFPKQIYQHAQELVSLLFSTDYAEVDRRKRELDLERERMLREQENRREVEIQIEKDRLEKKEAWKKKRKYFYGLGGIIGGLVFIFLPMLEKYFEITLGISIVSIIVSFILWWFFDLDKWWILLIGGVFMFIIAVGIYVLSELLPSQAIFFPIGFIIGVLISPLIRKIYLL